MRVDLKVSLPFSSQRRVELYSWSIKVSFHGDHASSLVPFESAQVKSSSASRLRLSLMIEANSSMTEISLRSRLVAKRQKVR